MSTKTNDLKEASLVPGAFPDEVPTPAVDNTANAFEKPQQKTQNEAAVREFKQQQHAAHTAGDNNTEAASTGGYENQDVKLREFKEQQHAAHTAGQAENTSPATANLDTPNIGQDLSSMASGLATAATAVGLAAKDAAIAAKDAAVPAASATADQVRSAAGYPSSTPTDTSRGRTQVARGVPSQVESSLAKAGEAPEAAASSEAVHNKQEMEGELLHQVEPQDDAVSHEDNMQRRAPREPVAAPSGDYEDELAPSSQTPGVVKVFSTEKARSFPLGETHHEDVKDVAAF